MQYENLFALENSYWTRAASSYNVNFLVQINFHIARKPCCNCIIVRSGMSLIAHVNIQICLNSTAVKAKKNNMERRMPYDIVQNHVLFAWKECNPLICVYPMTTAYQSFPRQCDEHADIDGQMNVMWILYCVCMIPANLLKSKEIFWWSENDAYAWEKNYSWWVIWRPINC